MRERMPEIVRGDARALDLPPESVDLIVTSPPYFGLRSYQDGGEHYDGQIGSEPTPAEFIAALIACTREWMRVLKPGGSIFVNLGDKYATRYSSVRAGGRAGLNDDDGSRGRSGQNRTGTPEKSLLLLPERYRIAAVDELGLIARAVIIWSKPNGLPESVADRVRRSHEDWVHLTKQPRYFAGVDEIREPHTGEGLSDRARGLGYIRTTAGDPSGVDGTENRRGTVRMANPLGKLPGSVWEIATQPLKVPAELGVDHFAAFPMEWPRRLILGWSPREVCTVCGEGRQPVVDKRHVDVSGGSTAAVNRDVADGVRTRHILKMARGAIECTVTGYACACPDTSAPSTQGVVLDPFGGTGTTALVAAMLGRTGISVDLSADYCRLARWRAEDPKERARAAGLDPDAVSAIKPQLPGQVDLFDLLDGEAS